MWRAALQGWEVARCAADAEQGLLGTSQDSAKLRLGFGIWGLRGFSVASLSGARWQGPDVRGLRCHPGGGPVLSWPRPVLVWLSEELPGGASADGCWSHSKARGEVLSRRAEARGFAVPEQHAMQRCVLVTLEVPLSPTPGFLLAVCPWLLLV